MCETPERNFNYIYSQLNHHRSRSGNTMMDKTADLAGPGIGEVRISVWPKALKEICAKKNIHVLE